MMLRLWHRIERSATLDHRTHAELVWMAYQSRYGVRWTVVSGDLPLIAILVQRSEAVPTFLVALFAATSVLRIALAEGYARFGSRSQPRGVQRRWDLAYLVIGSSYSAALATFVGYVVAFADPWMTAWTMASVVGFAYGIVGYVANRPAVAYAMTYTALGGSILALVITGEAAAYWMAGNLAIGCLALRSLIERHYAATMAAIADRRIAERFAETDHLTGLANRRLLEEVVDRILSEKVRGLHWLSVDLDGFKVVNDTWGHAAGDAVLRQAANRIRVAAGAGSLVARTGGDEFVVVLPGLRQHARAVAERIGRDLADPISVPGGVARIGASVGFTAIYERDSLDEIARRADERMYARKAVAKTAA